MARASQLIVTGPGSFSDDPQGLYPAVFHAWAQRTLDNNVFDPHVIFAD